MKPFRPVTSLAKWLLRIAIFAQAVISYFHIAQNFNFQSFTFYIAALFIIFSALLIIGGFFSKHSLTIISGLGIFLLSLYELFHVYEGSFLEQDFLIYFMMGALGLFFISQGNKT